MLFDSGIANSKGLEKSRQEYGLRVLCLLGPLPKEESSFLPGYSQAAGRSAILRVAAKVITNFPNNFCFDKYVLSHSYFSKYKV